MRVDSCYVIGSTHHVCQDYALSRDKIKSKKNTALIAVSDGCSSSPNTDFGSRFLVKALENLYACQEMNPIDMFFFSELNDRIDMHVTQISCLDMSCLDATLLFAYKTENTIEVVMIGDGTVTVKAKDGMIFSKTVEYKGNAPLYLSYMYSSKRAKLREAQFDCTKTITEYMHKNGTILNSTKRISTNDIERFSFAIEDYESVTIFSDGVSSFVQKHDMDFSRVPEHVVIEHMIRYSGYIPNNFYNVVKTLSLDKKINTDDFSAATFILE